MATGTRMTSPAPASARVALLPTAAVVATPESVCTAAMLPMVPTAAAPALPPKALSPALTLEAHSPNSRSYAAGSLAGVDRTGAYGLGLPETHAESTRDAVTRAAIDLAKANVCLLNLTVRREVSGGTKFGVRDRPAND